jgi:hypothetical protein
MFKKLVQDNDAAFKYENINFYGKRGRSNNLSNTIFASTTLEYENSGDSSLVTHELVTGSSVVSGTE